MTQYSLRRVAIDGLAASGKSTVAKALASKLELGHLDTGAMYRAVAYGVVRDDLNFNDEVAVVKFAKNLKIDMKPDSIFVDGIDVTKEIRSKEVTQIVSQVASYKKVRKQLRKKQLEWLKDNNGGVLDGRDIGTVVLPKADIKIFVIASAEIRAERRAKDSGRPIQEVLRAIKERDEFDRNRKHAPLKEAKGAFKVDTSGKEVEEVVDEIMEIVRDRYEQKLKDAIRGIDQIGVHKFWVKRYFVRGVSFAVYIAFKLYLRGKIYNRKNIPKKGAVILAPAAHRSNLDTPIVGAALPRLMRYMAKDSLYAKGRFWSHLIMTLGGFPVRRNRMDKKAVDTARELLSQGHGIVVFPEGERKEGTRVFPLLAGVVWLSVNTGTPILPIGFAGGNDAMPIGRKVILPKKVVIYVGNPIHPPTERISRREIDQLNDELRETLQNLYDKAQALL